MQIVERRKSPYFSSLSLLSPCLTVFPLLPPFLSFLFLLTFSFNLTYFKLSLISGSHGATCHTIVARIRFHLETIHFLVVQFILIELISSHSLASEIFMKISSLESLATHHLENRKNSDCLIIRRNFSR